MADTNLDLLKKILERDTARGMRDDPLTMEIAAAVEKAEPKKALDEKK